MNNYGILIVVIVLIMSTLIAMAGQTQIFGGFESKTIHGKI
jgi:hypothetical protein